MRSSVIPRSAGDGRVRSRRWRRVALTLLSVPVIALAASSAMAKARGNGRDTSTRELQRVADAIRQRLGIDRSVVVALVATNPHVVSVEAPQEPGGAFVVQVEEQMLQTLAADELEAALAHELGHVWIFTHHPFLQTELGANQVAMRTVSRDALARVYAKVWKSGGKGNLSAFLGGTDPK